MIYIDLGGECPTQRADVQIFRLQLPDDRRLRRAPFIAFVQRCRVSMWRRLGCERHHPEQRMRVRD